MAKKPRGRTFEEKRAFDSKLKKLKKSGKTWPEIAEILNSEGLKNAAGEDWTKSSISNYYNRLKKPGSTAKDKPTGRTKPETSPTVETSINTEVKAPEPDHVSSHTQQPDISPTHAGSGDSVPPQSEISMTELAPMVADLVRKELNRMFGAIELEQIQKSGRGGGSASVKKSFSIPKDVWEEINKLGGIMSNHITAALRIYLKLKGEGQA
jgi:hypothetical protein